MLAVLAALLDLVLPRSCVGCGYPGVALCAACGPGEPVRRLLPGGPPVLAAGEYDGALRRALLAYKERGRRDLADPLGRLLATAVRESTSTAAAAARATAGVWAGETSARGSPPVSRGAPPVLVCVPSDRARAAERGGDHVLRLARVAARRSGVRVAPGVLRQRRVVADSAGLGIRERAANLHDALTARPGGGRVALLVDDIVTTGATLGEAQRALQCAGWEVAGAVVVAATPRRVPQPIGSTHATGLASG